MTVAVFVGVLQILCASALASSDFFFKGTKNCILRISTTEVARRIHSMSACEPASYEGLGPIDSITRAFIRAIVVSTVACAFATAF